jgi:hypothetical protein
MCWMPLGHVGRGAVPEPFRDPLKGGRKGSGPALAGAFGLLGMRSATGVAPLPGPAARVPAV